MIDTAVDTVRRSEANGNTGGASRAGSAGQADTEATLAAALATADAADVVVAPLGGGAVGRRVVLGELERRGESR